MYTITIDAWNSTIYDIYEFILHVTASPLKQPTDHWTVALKCENPVIILFWIKRHIHLLNK
jgi:hypothetical protein